MVVTASWALNGESSLGLTLAQLDFISRHIETRGLGSYIFENGSPPSREKAQNTLPVPIKT